ncbi:hypothetical protein [Humibacter sp. RRB41]|uniref:hypothetical protein n=1 Tax=Humibacter sp. RRB41 TaxID=2919946 RepID=UPI001FAAD3EF|nr:hypothetical protein [Humibacter sp. RRB41]
MRRHRMLVLASAATVAALALCGCTAASPSSTGTPTAAADSELSSKEAAAKVMATPKPLPVLATAKGTLEANGTASPVVAEVLRIHATATSTVVTWRLKSASDAKVRTASFQLAYPPLMDTRLLGIVDAATHTTYRPYTYVPAQGNGDDLACACSTLPDYVDATGEVMYGVVPPLPASVTKADVTLPGFSTVTVAVDRSAH